MASKFGGIPVTGSKFGGIPVTGFRPVVIPEEEDDRTLGDSVNDFVANFGVGTGQVVSLLGSAYGLATGDMENRLTASGARTSEFWEKRRTPAYKEAERLRQEKIDAAEGELQKAGVAIWETLSNPMLLVGELAKQVPNLAVGGAGGAGGKVVVGTAGKVFGREVSEQALTRAGAAAATGTGVGLSSADFGQSAYEQLMSLPDEVWLANPQVQERIGGNMDLFPQVKREIATGLAQNSAIAGGLVTYGLNKLPGAKTIEKALGGEALTGTRLRRAATGFAGETLSEGLEEGATQLTANIAQAQIDPNARLTTGLGQAAGLGAVTGGGLGLISGALAPGREAAEPVEELKFGEPQVAPAEVSAEQASDFARTRLEELISKGKGTPDTEAVDPVTGQKRTVPGRPAQFLSDNEKAELEFLVNNVRDPNAIADAYNLKIKASADQRLNEATNVADAIQAAADMVDLDIEALEREAGISTFAEPVVTAQAVTEPVVTAQAVTEPAVTAQAVTEPTVTAQAVTEPTVTAQAVTEPGLTVDVLSRADISAMPAPERQEFLSDLTAARTANLPEQREQALARAAETYGRTVGPIQQPVARQTPAEAISAARGLTAARPEPTAAPDLNALLAADTRAMDEESRADFNAQLAMARTNTPGPVQTAALNRAAEIYGRTVGPIQTRQAQAPALRTAVPRPTRILGRPAAQYTEADLQAVIADNRTPAVTRRGAEIELRARTTAAPVTQETTIDENFISLPEALPDTVTGPVAGQSSDDSARASAQRTIDQWAASQGVESPVTFDAAPADLQANVKEIADLIGSQWGGRVVAFSDSRPGAINGVAIGQVAYVNVVDSQAGVQRTALHEFKHTVEQIAKAEAAAGLTDTPAQDFVDQIDSVFDDMTEEGKRAYLENFMAAEELADLEGDAREERVQELLESPELRSEMVADFLGNRATDKKFWQDLAKADPTGFESFVQRWLAAIDNLLAKLRGAKGRSKTESAKVDSYIRDLNRAKLTAQSALINYRKATAAPAEAEAAEGEVQFSRAQPLVETADLVGATKLAKSQNWARGRDFKVALQQRVLDAGMAEGIDTTQDTPQTREYLLDVGLRDALTALKQNANAIGWYDTKTRQALAVMALVHPEIARDQDARFAFTWALAVTSNGMRVGKNFEMAEKAYEAYKRDGKMPSDIGVGTSGEQIDNGLELFNTLRDEWGIENLRKFMQTSFTVSEISGISKALKPSGEHADVTVKGAAILGPKIGNGFFSNLYGDFSSLTMDRWLVRTWGRWTGTLIKAMPEQTAKARERLQSNVRLINADPVEAKRLGDLLGRPITQDVDALAVAVKEASMDPKTRARMNETEAGLELRKAGNSLAKYLDGQKEAPQNPDERKYIRSVFNSILDDLKQTNTYKDLTMADLQAVLWYAEKRLYETAKEEAQDLSVDEDVEGYADESAPDYANAAAAVAREKGITDRRINAALKRIEDERSGRARPAAADGDAGGQVVGAGQPAAPGGFTRQERRKFIGERAVLRSRANRAGDAQQSGAYAGDGGADGGSVRVLKALGVSYTQTWKASRNLGTVFRANDLPAPEFIELAPTLENATKFQAAIAENKAAHPFGAAVYVYPAEEYQGMRLFLTKDGKSGVAIKPDGDIVSVFSTGGAGRAIMELAVSAGGRKLDAFDTILPEFYAPHGFRAVARTRWNDDYAPEEWDKQTFQDFNNGEPDVVFMVYDPSKMDAEYSRKDGKVTDYDRAVALQNRNLPAVTADPSAADEVIAFSKRQKPAPKKTVTAYKLFRVDPRRPGQIFPLFVNANDPVPFGEWQDADIGPLGEGGKVKSKLGLLAFRPGWHAGDLPIATHIGQKSDSSLRAPDQRADNQVWAEVELAADRDWQGVADERGKNAQGKIIAARAHITDQVPEDGFYRYKTSPNMVGKWLIGGSMKVNRLLSDAEVASINAAAGTADLPRPQPFNAKKYGFDDTDEPVRIRLGRTDNTAANKALDSLQAKLAANPLNDRELMRKGAAVNLSVGNGALRISDIRSTSPGQGEASELLDVVIAEADAAGAKLTLFADSYVEDGGLSTEALVNWYSRRGFEEVRRDEDGVEMRRYPASLQFSRAQTNTPEFKRWFGKSKVVDEQGQPLVVYHGARPGVDFDEFDTGVAGSYFTPNPGYAAGFTNDLFGDFGDATGQILPVYLSLQNPKIVRAKEGSTEWDSFVNFGTNKRALQEEGFDGAILVDSETGEIDQVIALEPTQIKSAIGNVGTFDPADSRIMFSRAQKSPLKLYSALERAAEAGPARAPAQQWKGTLRNQKGVTPEEIEWSGVNDWLDLQTGQVSRDDVVGYLAQNGVQIEEAVKSADDSTTKYDEYVAPGGTNYREILLKLPAKAGRPVFSSRHWQDDKNVLAHIRVNDRLDDEGNEVLFIEELQSDWAQQGREEGFYSDKRLRAEIVTSPTRGRRWVVYQEDGTRVYDSVTVPFEPGREQEVIDKAREFMSSSYSNMVFRGPFVGSTGSWLDLALKRVVAMAVEEGYAKVAFSTGDQNAKRYSMDKTVSRIELDDNSRFFKGLMPYASDFTLEGPVSPGTLRVFDKKGDLLFTDAIKSEADVRRILGKEISNMLIESPAQEESLDNAGRVRRRVLEGPSLEIGGEGMRTFYDSIVPKALNKLLPKIGGDKVQPLALTFGSPESVNVPGFDVTPAMTDQVMDVGLPLFSRAQNIFGRPMPAGTWQVEDRRLDTVIYNMQDKLIDTKRVVESINSAVGQIEDKWDPYLQEKLYHGAVSKQTKDFAKNELKPLIETMGRNKVTIEEFDKYLHNRHAEERNAAIAQRNPALPDAGSGIATADAKAYLAALPAARKVLLEGLARRIDTLTEGTRKILVASGLEAQSTIDAWDNVYKKYVPLMREELDYEGSSGPGTGRGFSVRGSASRRAVGSADRKVVDILANLVMQRERAIVRATKNKVSQALYGLALKNPSPDFWMPINPDAIKDPQALTSELIAFGVDPLDAENIAKEPMESYVDPRTGLVSTRVNRRLRNLPNVVYTRVNGKDRFLVFNSQSPRAERMAKAINNLDMDNLVAALSMAAVGTRWFASVNTQYNPIFGVVNLGRDLGAGALNLTTTPIADKKAQVIADSIPALRGIYRAVRGKAGQNNWANLWDEFQEVGGQTGFRDQFSQSEERARALQGELDDLSSGVAKKSGKAVLEWLSDYNTAMENAVRLSAYKAALDKGMSKQRAAELAKDLTVNFNKKGAVSTNMGALYAFFNASVQGTTRLAQTLAGPAGKKIVYGGLLLGSMQALLLMAAGFEDDEPPGFIKERNLVIPIGGGDYLTWPMPLGFNVIPNIGRITTEWALSGFERTPDRAIEMATSFFDMFNPIGNAGLSMQTLLPTVIDPFAALAENKDWTGAPISREDLNSLAPTPGYLRARDSASWLATELSRFFNLATGGTDFTPGKFSPTPEQLEYLAGQITGGVGRETGKTVKTVESLISGEELPPYSIPLAGRLYGKTTGSAAESNRFYENIRRINLHNAELRGLRQTQQPVGPYLNRNPEARLATQARTVYRQVQNLRKRKREMLDRNASRESIRLIEQQITNRMKSFNERMSRIES